MTSLDQFKAEVFAGDPEATEIQQITREYGYEVRAASATATHNLSSVRSLHRVYRMVSMGARLRRVLRLYQATGHDRALAGEMVEGLAVFLGRYGEECNEGRIVDVFRRTGLVLMAKRAMEQRVAQPRMTAASAWGRALLAGYNKDLRSNKLPEWADKDFSTDAVQSAIAARRRKNTKAARGVR
jgi:hypothetical protein